MNRFLGLCLLLLSGALWADNTDDEYRWQWQGVERIVAFADVHGAYRELVPLLQQAGVVDKQLRWIGGSTHLVSLGDLLDRGSDSRRVMDLMMRLQLEAEAAGGRVHQLLGNHELMNMIGDLRYVSEEEYAAFIDDESWAAREQVRQRYREFSEQQGVRFDPLRFEQQFPPGFFAHRQSFSQQGAYGKWLTRSPFIIKINDTLFTHGGISPQVAELGGEQANEKSKQDMLRYLELSDKLIEWGLFYPETDFWSRYDHVERFVNIYKGQQQDMKLRSALRSAKAFLALRDSELSGGAGLLWYRGSARCHPATESRVLARAFEQFSARRLVIGHTPTSNRRVSSRIDGQVIALDTGMLASAYRGRASALIIEGDSLTTMYAGESEITAPLPEPPWIAGQRMSDAELEQFLLTAEVVEKKHLSTGVTKPMRLTLEKDGVRMRALYKNYDSSPRLLVSGQVARKDEKSDRYQHEVAAYKLDRLLGINRVPVAVVRRVGPHRGVVQQWIGGMVSGRELKEQGLEIGGDCSRSDQNELRDIFDILIYNEDRNLGNLLYSKSNGSLWLIDHSQAFNSIKTASKYARPRRYRDLSIDVSPWMRRRLEAVTPQQLDTELGMYLHRKQIKALLMRRDQLLEGG